MIGAIQSESYPKIHGYEVNHDQKYDDINFILIGFQLSLTIIRSLFNFISFKVQLTLKLVGTLLIFQQRWHLFQFTFPFLFISIYLSHIFFLTLSITLYYFIILVVPIFYVLNLRFEIIFIIPISYAHNLFVLQLSYHQFVIFEILRISFFDHFNQLNDRLFLEFETPSSTIILSCFQNLMKYFPSEQIIYKEKEIFQ